MAGDNNSASSCSFIFLDIINLIKPLTSISSFEPLCEIIITDTAGIDDRARWQDILNECMMSQVCRYG